MRTQCAQRYGARPFVVTDDVTLSYADVADQSRRMAAGMVALGVEPGDRVGMVMANYPEFVTVKFAIARAGAIAVPFNYLYRANELGFRVGRLRLPRPGDHDRRRQLRRCGTDGCSPVTSA